MTLTDKEQSDRVKILIEALGIDIDSFLIFIEWALSEQLVGVLTQRIKSLNDETFFTKPVALKRFRDILRKETGFNNWSHDDLQVLFNAVKKKSETHYREPLEYGEYLKLIWYAAHQCSKCGKQPPEVKLHIDHIIPASLGGKSNRKNIQFLCESCNLKKSNKLQGGTPWLQLW